jgi:hypothetical protein
MFRLWLCIDMVEAAQRIVRMPMVECTIHHKPIDGCRTEIKEDCCI